MAISLLMPALSPTMTEGTLAKWCKKEGDEIKAGDIIAEIETDKATMEFEAVDEGFLGKILVLAGTAGVAVNSPIAVLVEEGEAVPENLPSAPVTVPVSAQAATVSEAPKGGTEPAQKAAVTEEGGRIAVSPLAKRIAAEKGLSLAGVVGSGPHGRIVRADVEKALSAPGVQPIAALKAVSSQPQQAAAVSDGIVSAKNLPDPYQLEPHSSMRKIIAARLSESKRTVPHFYLKADCKIDALLDLRSKLNAHAPKEGAGTYKLSVNDMLIKAAAVAMTQVPGVNASFTAEGIARYENIDISVAVAIPDGLITPIVRKANQKGLQVISAEMKELAGKAKNGKLKPEEFQGGGFTISNLGMFDMKEFAAIINPPQAAILAVGAGEKRPVVEGDEIKIATMMTVVLSVDHRVVDGALGAQWLAAFKKIVENPFTLML